ncbi:serine/threonine-protein kinase [Streptomyces javensis]|uniref:Protein kinase domain-containing protein n=1 Tax=Streptomyces javensis TaxID=114698 RepID=A0ABN1XE17_9ACTN
MVSPLTHDDPQALGSYTLLARLGGGGMGTVYLGRSPKGRMVALKTVHTHYAEQAEFRTRFQLETDAARVIGGQHGAQVIDADPLARTPWLATEYVLGPPLDDAVALAGPLPEQAVRALGAALCDALAQLHRSDVVHRDLKPSNILLTALGPKVIDFGIARAVGDDRLTRTGAAAGTPAYMSPEQVSGGEHTAAGDVFALAGVLVFAATGRPPFGGGQPADLLYRVRYTDPGLAGLPGGLRTVLEPCFAKDPRQRPGTVELGERLRTGAHHAGDIRRFADQLPDLVLAEIARRCTAVWEAQPSRLPAPREAEHRTETAGPGRVGAALSRRKLIAAVGGGALVAGGAAGAWAWLDAEGSDGGTAAAPRSTRRPAGAGPRLVWKMSVPEATTDLEALIVGDHVVIVHDNGLLCVDAKTGEKRGESDRTVPVVIDGDRLLACEADDQSGATAIAPVDLETGNLKTPIARTGALGLEPKLLAVMDGTLFAEGFAKGGEKRLAINLRTGKRLWARAIAPGTSDPIAAASAGARLLRFSGEEAIAIDPHSGAQRWSKRIPLGSDAVISLDRAFATTGDHVFTGGRELLALRTTDGATAWRFGAERKSEESYDPRMEHYGPPAVKDDVVYSVERRNGLVALDAQSGRLLWQEKGAADQAASSEAYESTPVVGERYFYASPEKDRWARAVDLRTHRTAWTFQGPSGDKDGMSASVMRAHRRAGLVIITNGKTVCAIPLE